MPDMFKSMGQQGAAPHLPPQLQKPRGWQTYLQPHEEAAFQQWVQANHIPFDLTRPEAAQDYDMRGYWKAMMAGDPNAQRGANLHFPDTYKTPWHVGFSNESKYAQPTDPHWVGDKLYNQAGQLLRDESKGGADAKK
jgi:hypothetical protein